MWKRRLASAAALQPAVSRGSNGLSGTLRRAVGVLQKCFIDRRGGGWIWVGRDARPRRRALPKATNWKEPSHEVHSLLECLRLLRSGP